MTATFTGPESTGKTTLANLLAKHYNAPLINEYAREYLTNLTKNYTQQDVLIMAKKQLYLEQTAIKQEPNLLFLDTDLITYKIWLSVKYNTKIDWIEQQISSYTYKHYFLCANGLPWMADALREHPKLEDRETLFSLYLATLKENNLSFTILSGNLDERIEKCVAFLSL